MPDTELKALHIYVKLLLADKENDFIQDLAHELVNINPRLSTAMYTQMAASKILMGVQEP